MTKAEIKERISYELADLDKEIDCLKKAKAYLERGGFNHLAQQVYDVLLSWELSRWKSALDRLPRRYRRKLREIQEELEDKRLKLATLIEETKRHPAYPYYRYLVYLKGKNKGEVKEPFPKNGKLWGYSGYDDLAKELGYENGTVPSPPICYLTPGYTYQPDDLFRKHLKEIYKIVKHYIPSLKRDVASLEQEEKKIMDLIYSKRRKRCGRKRRATNLKKAIK